MSDEMFTEEELRLLVEADKEIEKLSPLPPPVVDITEEDLSDKFVSQNEDVDDASDDELSALECGEDENSDEDDTDVDDEESLEDSFNECDEDDDDDTFSDNHWEN